MIAITVIIAIAVAVVVTLVSSNKAQAKKSKELYLDLFDEYKSLEVSYSAALRLLTDEQLDNLEVPRDMEQCIYGEQLLTDEQLDYVAEEYSELFSSKPKPRHLSLTLSHQTLAKITSLKNCCDLIVSLHGRSIFIEIKDGSKPKSARKLT